jgi:hypothetical protein
MIVGICILTIIPALSAILPLTIPIVGLSLGSGVHLKPERLYLKHR